MADIQDSFEELVGKGSEMFSNLSEMAGDLAVKVKIKAQLLDQNLEYDGLMKQLGEAVYDEVKRDEHYTSAHPSLFAKIVEVDQRRKALEEEYARIEAQSAEKEQKEQDQQEQQEQASDKQLEEPKASEEQAQVETQPEQTSDDQPQGDAE